MPIDVEKQTNELRARLGATFRGDPDPVDEVCYALIDMHAYYNKLEADLSKENASPQHDIHGLH